MVYFLKTVENLEEGNSENVTGSMEQVEAQPAAQAMSLKCEE